MPRREPGPAELEALDPLTGESLTSPGATATGPTANRRDRRAARARTLRRVMVVSVLLAVTCASAGAYFAVSIAQLRGIERTWRQAMALDGARADADREVRDVLASVTSSDADDPSTLAPLEAIGTEVATGLRRHERALADRRILDSKVSDLRDAMVDALEFRRFQLSPTRDRIGNTPLERVESSIDDQLARWDLSPSEVDAPTLRSLAPALAELRRYADVDTETVLFALDGTTLHTIDVDASTRRRRSIPFPGVLVPTNRGVAVVGTGRLVVYPPDPSAQPLATIDGDVLHAVGAGDGSGDLWVAQAGAPTVRRYRVDGASSGWAGAPVVLRPGRMLVGATADHLVLQTPTGGLVLVAPSTPDVERTLATADARFLDAEGTIVLFQGPLPFNPGNGSDFLHRYDVGTDLRDLIGLPRTDAATASIGRDGGAAVTAGPLAGRLGSILVLGPRTPALVGGGTTGPRASVEPNTVAWAPDGEALFWLTPDGELAIAHGDGPGIRQRLRVGLQGLDRLVAIGR